MDRRTLLTAAIATPLAAIPVMAEPITPVMAAFAEWQDQFDYCYFGPERSDWDEAREDVEFWKVKAVEDRLVRLPSANATDLAAKIYVVTNCGDFEMSCVGGEFIMREVVVFINPRTMMDQAIERGYA